MEVNTMTNEQLNTALYQKMFAEQETYRAWLLSQPLTEILNHAYEYTVREDILLALKYHNLPDAQARALLKSPSPLSDVFEDWQDRETGHMDDIWQTVEDRAQAEVQKQVKKEKEFDKARGLAGISNRPFLHSRLSKTVNTSYEQGGQTVCLIFHRRSSQKPGKWIC